MCAVCWTGAQIIPVGAVAGRYVWVNHIRGRRPSAGPPAEEPSPEEQSSMDADAPVSV